MTSNALCVYVRVMLTVVIFVLDLKNSTTMTTINIPKITLLEQLPEAFNNLTAQLSEILQGLKTNPADSTDPEKLYTIAEAAAHLRISRQTLRNYTTDGLIQETKVGSKIFYKHKDILSATGKLNRKKAA